MVEESTTTSGKLYSDAARKVRPPTNQSNKPNPANTTSSFTNKHPLNPKCSVFIYDKESITKDKIRSAINRVLGPTLIVSINRYALDSKLLKYMVQLKKETNAQQLVKKWKNDSLEYTKVRWAKSSEKYVGTLSGVPHDFEEHELQNDIERAYPGSKCSHIMKQDKPTYTVKVVFPDQSSLSKSL